MLSKTVLVVVTPKTRRMERFVGRKRTHVAEMLDELGADYIPVIEDLRVRPDSFPTEPPEVA